jgi:hypothetical protein
VKAKRNAYRILVRKPEEKRAPGRTMCDACSFPSHISTDKCSRAQLWYVNAKTR